MASQPAVVVRVLELPLVLDASEAVAVPMAATPEAYAALSLTSPSIDRRWRGHVCIPAKDIAEENYVMFPDACGLARATRVLFRSHRRKLHEYPGESMSYQVLEQWTGLGTGAAIVPTSKLSILARSAMSIIDKAGRGVTLPFEAAWSRGAGAAGPREALPITCVTSRLPSLRAWTRPTRRGSKDQGSDARAGIGTPTTIKTN